MFSHIQVCHIHIPDSLSCDICSLCFSENLFGTWGISAPLVPRYQGLLCTSGLFPSSPVLGKVSVNAYSLCLRCLDWSTDQCVAANSFTMAARFPDQNYIKRRLTAWIMLYLRSVMCHCLWHYCSICLQQKHNILLNLLQYLFNIFYIEIHTDYRHYEGNIIFRTKYLNKKCPGYFKNPTILRSLQIRAQVVERNFFGWAEKMNTHKLKKKKNRLY